jgi:uncharacterized metal-binding protein
MKVIQGVQLNFKTHTIWRVQYFLQLLKIRAKKNCLALKKANSNEKALLYSCSGSCNSSQMANHIAVQLYKRKIAEKSCIAVEGGNIKKVVQTALSGRSIIVIDGCKLACAKACFDNQSLKPDFYFELTSLGIEKRQQENYDCQHAEKILSFIQDKITKYHSIPLNL